MAARAVMAASAHRPREAANARRWKVVVIVAPVSGVAWAGARSGDDTAAPPTGASDLTGGVSRPQARKLSRDHPQLARPPVQGAGTTCPAPPAALAPPPKAPSQGS